MNTVGFFLEDFSLQRFLRKYFLFRLFFEDFFRPFFFKGKLVVISLQRFLREYCLFGFFLEGVSLPSFFGRFFFKKQHGSDFSSKISS